MDSVDKSTFLQERYFKELIRKINKHSSPINQTEKEPYFIEKAKLLDSLLPDSNILIVLANISNLKIIHIGNNFQNLTGYNVDEAKELGFQFFFKILDSAHVDFLTNTVNWGLRCEDFKPKDVYIKKNYYCGLKVYTKENKLKRVFLNSHIFNYDNDFRTAMTIYYVFDVSHLMKGDAYWGRVVFGKNGEYPRFFLSEGEKTEYPDIISKRELEILKLIEENKSTKEIGTLLGISANTVEKHRKNMIKRVGAKDSTALIQLCKMSGIL